MDVHLLVLPFKMGIYRKRHVHCIGSSLETRRAQPSPQACAVPMKWNQEGTATVVSLCCAHEMKPGGHSHRRKSVLCP